MASAIATLATAVGASASTAATISAALPSLSTVATAASVAGTGLGALGVYQQGQQSRAAGKFQAQQLEQEGNEAAAISGRRAKQYRREKDLASSRARAVAAASGAGSDGATVTNLMEGIERQGEYNALVEMYQGRATQRKRYAQAGSARASGSASGTAGTIGSLTRLGSGVSSIYSRR